MTKILYKSLPADRKPHGFQFKKNVWHKAEGELEICKNGFHASKNIIDALGYINCEYLAKVEVKGEHIIENDKECWEYMRVIEWYKWTKKDSLRLAIFSAEQVLCNFEKSFPKDTRVRDAIEAAKKVLLHDTEKNRSAAKAAVKAAACSARSARSARSAEFSACSACSAESAAWAAWNAVFSACSAWNAVFSACSAESAAVSAMSAARSAARSAAWAAAWAAVRSAAWAARAARTTMKNKLHKFIYDKKFKKLLTK